MKRVAMEKEPSGRDRWLTDEEEKMLLSVSPQWLREMIIFAVDTGCRRGELLSVAWKHMNLVSGVATIFGQKTGEWRGIPLTRRVKEMFLAKQASRKVRGLRQDVVFSNDAGQTVNIHELRWAFESALKEAEIGGFRWHDLR